MKFYGGGKNKDGSARPPYQKEDSFYPQEEEISSEELENIFSKVPVSDGVSEASTPAQERKRMKEKKLAGQEHKKAKRKRTPAEKRRRRILTLILALSICTAGYAAFKLFVKAPEMNQGTIADNGDALTVQGENRKDNYFTFFIGATDEDGTRTDTMMMASVDIANKTVNVLNIPRDTMSDVSRTNKKINGAYGKGIEGTRDEIHQLLGYDFDKYIVFSFDAIEQFVDIVHGVDYDVPINMYYDDPSQNLHIHFTKGEQHLNGKQVVEFLRWRKNNDGTGYARGDIDRIAKQQEFLKVLAAKFLTPTNVIRIPEMAQCISENVKTDMTKGQMIWLGIQTAKIGSSNIHMYVLPGESRYIDGLSYYVGDKKKTLTMLNEDFDPYNYDLTEDDLDIIAPKATQKPIKVDRDNDDLGTVKKENENTTEKTKGDQKTDRVETKKDEDSQSSSRDDASSGDSTSSNTASSGGENSSSGTNSSSSGGESSSSGATSSSADHSSGTTNQGSLPVDPELS